jgi:hypothetical protein
MGTNRVMIEFFFAFFNKPVKRTSVSQWPSLHKGIPGIYLLSAEKGFSLLTRDFVNLIAS